MQPVFCLRVGPRCAGRCGCLVDILAALRYFSFPNVSGLLLSVEGHSCHSGLSALQDSGRSQLTKGLSHCRPWESSVSRHSIKQWLWARELERGNLKATSHRASSETWG